MSHIVSVKTEFRQPQTLKKVCDQRGVPCRIATPGKNVTENLFGGPVSGVASFQPNGWRYPVVVQEDGQTKLDNYNGAWGKMSEFDSIAQAYTKEVVATQLRSQGFRVAEERVEEDGTVRLTVMQ